MEIRGKTHSNQKKYEVWKGRVAPLMCVWVERTSHPVRKTKSSCGRMCSPQQVPARRKGFFSCETKTAACHMIDITVVLLAQSRVAPHRPRCHLNTARVLGRVCLSFHSCAKHVTSFHTDHRASFLWRVEFFRQWQSAHSKLLHFVTFMTPAGRLQVFLSTIMALNSKSCMTVKAAWNS